MTYLEVVNGVMRRLRERAVSTVAQTTYSTMVGDFVNDAKKQIEAAWEWGANRSILTIPTVNAQQEYSLTGFGAEGIVLDGWNSTSKTRFYDVPQAWFNSQEYTGSPISGPPYRYTYQGLDGSGDTKIKTYPTPDGVYSLKLNCCIPQVDLSADTDVLRIPARQVILLAVAMLAEEKGETGGAQSARYFQMAEKEMGNSIAIDANRYPYELNWVGV